MKQEQVLEQKEKEEKRQKQEKQAIPKVLEERLLISEEHRKILKAAEKLSPVDTGYIYMPGNPLDRQVPTVGMIAEEAGMKEEEVRKKISEIKDVWKLPDKLPTNFRFTEEEALISALVNQHKLRWDPEIGDYRVPRIHVYNGELGTGMLYTNKKAFLGEQLFRRATGLNEMLNSYHVQGGVMPSIIMMFGKRKNNAAIMTGLNQTGKIPSKKEFDNLKNLLEMVQKGEITPKQAKNLRDYVVNTIDSQPEAAGSVAHELAVLLKGIPEHVPIHLFYSFNDDSNLSEIEDVMITNINEIRRLTSKAAENLPKMKEQLHETKRSVATFALSLGVADYLLKVIAEAEEAPPKEGEKKEGLPTGKAFRKYIDEKFFFEENGNASPGLKKLKITLKKRYFTELGREDEADFEREFENAKIRYFNNPAITELGDIKRRKGVDEKKRTRTVTNLVNLKDGIAELEEYAKAIEAEKQEGHAWFTKKIAITPTQAKAKLMLEKIIYKDIYEKILIPKVKELLGKNLNINLHTDREISVFVEDPATLLKMNDYPDNKLYGTIITSVPRTNRQRSNEPLLDSIRELQKKHETAIATRLKLKMQKPKTVREFAKRHSSAFSDVIFTSWGADGYRMMPKFVIEPTELRGEYQGDTETAWYLKCPTRHDVEALGDLLKKGNRGTWEGKRLEKGGPTTGNVVQIIYPDQSQEWMFVDDKHYEWLADTFGAKAQALEKKLANARSETSRQKLTEELEEIYEQVRPNMGYVLLANDLHFGAFNLQGRPNNIDYIRASQLAALQSLGFNTITAAAETEALHGDMKIRSHGYYSYKEGQLEDPITFGIKLGMLENGLKKQGANLKTILEHVQAYTEEQMHSRSVFHPEKQKEMFKNLAHPMFVELMENDVVVYFGSGNHWQQSHSENEANALALMFNQKYAYKGLLRTLDTSTGQSYSIDTIKLPSNEGIDIRAVLAHKMWHGSTEISDLANQAIGQKKDALFYITADRHHPGQVAEKERYFVLDVGKQTTMKRVPEIGKASSVRGTAAMGYSQRRDLLYSMRLWLDPVVSKIIGWDEKREVLKTNWDTIQSEMADYYAAKK